MVLQLLEVPSGVNVDVTVVVPVIVIGAMEMTVVVSVTVVAVADVVNVGDTSLENTSAFCGT